MLRYFTLLIALGSYYIGLSQDVHMSQYYTSNLSLNPAYTGFYDGDYRFTLNYRNQWRQLSSPIETTFLSAEKNIPIFGDAIGIGLIFIDDQVPTLHLKSNKLLLSVSYQKNINRNLIRFGVQGGMGMRRADFSNETFPDQWDYQNGDFNQSLPNGEGNLVDEYNYVDINAGASWTKRFGRFKPTVGYAAHHINQPKEGFSDSNALPIRHSINGWIEYDFNNSWSIFPHILYMTTTGTKNLILGVLGKYKFTKDIYVSAGISRRGDFEEGDSFFPVVGFGYKRLEFGLSNDYNISELSTTGEGQNKSSFEISLIYTTLGSGPSKSTVACDRF